MQKDNNIFKLFSQIRTYHSKKLHWIFFFISKICKMKSRSIEISITVEYDIVILKELISQIVN